MMKRLSGLVLLLCLANFLSAQDMHMDTYCNPLNIDYTYMIYNSDKNISYRYGADPAVVEFRGEYYMFVTRSHGYWRSRDLLNWEFVLFVLLLFFLEFFQSVLKELDVFGNILIECV